MRRDPDYIGVMEKKMETTIVYWRYIGIILDVIGVCKEGISVQHQAMGFLFVQTG